jgi:hypothetical protein
MTGLRNALQPRRSVFALILPATLLIAANPFGGTMSVTRASTASPCTSETNPYSVDPSVLVGCGDQVFPLTGTNTTADGSSQYDYLVNGDSTV